MIHTKEEAIARAKAWLNKRSPQNNEPWAEVAHFNGYQVYFKPGNGGGCGGLVIVVSRGDDDEGTTVAVEEYSADSKTFRWDDERDK